ncbi:hypothetical protein OZX67_01165 [Bifidobacterium sp. ESL0728]|uniref:hypothetical protein n=1 Tax=Bifidobacterium sp. ESL0728 TaxID=2983220 RepID=UPI0023F7FB08|nr:hypothetical protein [Bifidobacterium sp. ESL0728]WEV59212.1 hypothetical protein OZX67_01165 [Bifidobacterium sp. ESL0728]
MAGNSERDESDKDSATKSNTASGMASNNGSSHGSGTVSNSENETRTGHSAPGHASVSVDQSAPDSSTVGTDQTATDNTQLSADQRAAISGLAKDDVYVRQSKWTTFRELPVGQKGSFFVQNFLLGTVVVVVVLAIVISLVVTYLTKPPTPVFTLEAVNMRENSQQISALKDGFVKYDNVKDARLVSFGSNLNIGKSSYTDDSPKIMTQIAAGQINAMISERKTLATLNKRGLVNRPSQVLTALELKRYLDMGVLIDAQGKPATSAKEAVYFDLSRSQTWKAKGLPGDALFGFANVKSGKDHPRAFVRYLDFK